MYRKKNFISLGMSLVLAAGITVTPVTAADFTDGTVPEFNSDDATEFDVQQETADNAEFASDTEDSISDLALERYFHKEIEANRPAPALQQN